MVTDLRSVSPLSSASSSATGTEPALASPSRAIVFVHGIYSSHTTFDPMVRAFESLPKFKDWRLYHFDYDFHASVQVNGRELADNLADRFNEIDEVVLVAHSMGGLVSRMAILERQMPFVRQLIMLGTPNFGALRTSQVGFLANAITEATQVVYGIFSRRHAVLDLRNAASIFRDYLKN